MVLFLSIDFNLRKQRHRKGQAFTADFLLSAVLFIIILFAAVELWNITASKYSKNDSYGIMRDKALSITDSLIKTEGYPSGWTNETVRMLGISEGVPNVLDKNKMLEMKNISYSKLRNVFGLSDYEVYLNFTNSSGATIVMNGASLEYGLAPFLKKDLVPMKRFVLINDSGNIIRSVLVFMIWR